MTRSELSERKMDFRRSFFLIIKRVNSLSLVKYDRRNDI